MSDENVLAPPAEPEVTPAPEGQAPEATPEAPATPPEGETPPAVPDVQPPKKSPVAQLQGRVGHLTKTLHERDAELERLRLQNETMQALLGGARQPDGTQPATPPTGTAPQRPIPAPGTAEFQDAVRQEAIRVAADQTFQAEADRINREGKEKLGGAWDESLNALNAMGILQRGFIEAAFATGDPIAVLSSLGEDLDEASRIASLPPIRMAAELTKMAAAKGHAAKPATPSVSRAPAPITPVGGAVNPTIDVYDPRISKGDHVSDDFLRARAKSGLPWYQRHRTG